MVFRNHIYPPLLKAALILLVSLLLNSFKASSQANTLSLGNGNYQHLSIEEFNRLKDEFGKNKQLPPGYEEQALIALSHFPELKNTYIEFRLHKSHATLKTRILTSSIFNDKTKRYYVITISTRSLDKLEPILIDKMNREAQIGILGHEISHVLDFSTKDFWHCTNVGIHHLSPTYVDSLEYHTDKITIDHGLGRELEAWSSFVRETMHVKNWRGSDYVNNPNNTQERYMNPDTIEKFMSEKQNNSPAK